LKSTNDLNGESWLAYPVWSRKGRGPWKPGRKRTMEWDVAKFDERRKRRRRSRRPL